jgi:hypothetical protein
MSSNLQGRVYKRNFSVVNRSLNFKRTFTRKASRLSPRATSFFSKLSQWVTVTSGALAVNVTVTLFGIATNEQIKSGKIRNK